MLRSLFLIIFVLLAVFSCRSEFDVSQLSEEEVLQRARQIHEKVLVLDTHVDINTANFTDEKNYLQDLKTQVTLPKMLAGGLDAAFLIVYTGQQELTKAGYDKAYKKAMAKFEAIHRLTGKIAPDKIGLATTSEQVRAIAKTGKKVALIGVENGYPLGTDVNNVKKFYDLGARYISLSHNGHSQLCDSNTGEKDSVWLHNGLSELGKKMLVEMNKYGIMIDVSHVSKKAMQDMVALTKAPIIASHSSARALCNHSRNLDDEQLQWLKANGGVAQTVAFDVYVDTEKGKAFRAARKAQYDSLAATIGFKLVPWKERKSWSQQEKNVYASKLNQVKELAKPFKHLLDKKAAPVTVADFVDHIDYMVEKIGIEHVGISSDFDGGGGVEGWQDASETLNVTIELVRRGYSEEQIALLWGGNLLRVLDANQKVAMEIQNQENKM